MEEILKAVWSHPMPILLMVRKSRPSASSPQQGYKTPLFYAPCPPRSPSNEIQHLSLTERSRGRGGFPDPTVFATHQAPEARQLGRWCEEPQEGGLEQEAQLEGGQEGNCSFWAGALGTWRSATPTTGPWESDSTGTPRSSKATDALTTANELHNLESTF